uniref:Homeobox protein 5-like n=1 Tax=Dermatophagoides pteronyssinus TaxID=6956 RepID=A0A6P6XTU8_DERPT|nr:homeobox protein 5-like [Dermatophagoides pteronyssinus]
MSQMIHINLGHQQNDDDDETEDNDDDDADADDNEKNQYNFNSFVNCRHLNLDHHPVSTIDIVNYQYYQNQQQLNNNHLPLLSSSSSYSSSSSLSTVIEPPQAFQDYDIDNNITLISSTSSMLYPDVDDEDYGGDECNQQPNNYIVTNESSTSPLVIFPYEFQSSNISSNVMLNNDYNDDMVNFLSINNPHQHHNTDQLINEISSSSLLSNINNDVLTISSSLENNQQQQQQPQYSSPSITEWQFNNDVNNNDYTTYTQPKQSQTAISNQLILNAEQYHLYRHLIQQQQLNNQQSIATMININNHDANNVGTNNCSKNNNNNNNNNNRHSTTNTNEKTTTTTTMTTATATTVSKSSIVDSPLSSSSMIEMNRHSHHYQQQQYFYYSTPPPPPSSPLILANNTIANANVHSAIDNIANVVVNSGVCGTGSLNNLPNVCYDSSPTSTYHYPYHQHYYNQHHHHQQQQHLRQQYQYRPPHHRLHPHQLERFASSNSLNHRNGTINGVNDNGNGNNSHRHHHHHHLMMNNPHLYHQQSSLQQQTQRSLNTGNEIGGDFESITNPGYRSSSLPSNNHTKVLIHHQCPVAITPPSHTPPLSIQQIGSTIDNTNCSVKSLPIEHNHRMNIGNDQQNNDDRTYCQDFGQITRTTMSNCRTQSTSPRPPSSTAGSITPKPSSMGQSEQQQQPVHYSDQAMVLAMVEEQAKQEAQLRELKGYEASAKYQPPLIDGVVAAAILTQSGTIIPDRHKRSCSEWRMTLFVFYWIIWIVFLIGVVIIVAANTRTE